MISTFFCGLISTEVAYASKLEIEEKKTAIQRHVISGMASQVRASRCSTAFFVHSAHARRLPAPRCIPVHYAYPHACTASARAAACWWRDGVQFPSARHACHALPSLASIGAVAPGHNATAVQQPPPHRHACNWREEGGAESCVCDGTPRHVCNCLPPLLTT